MSHRYHSENGALNIHYILNKKYYNLSYEDIQDQNITFSANRSKNVSTE